MKMFFERLKYWLTHPHKKSCPRCCLFCEYYDICKNDNGEADE